MGRVRRLCAGRRNNRAVVVALRQIKDIRSQNRRWRTLEICDRYHLGPHLVEIAARLRAVVDAVEGGEKDALPKRPDVVTMLNYLDGVAIGIYQRLYIGGLTKPD
jgi:hypothetical protein